MIRRLVEWIKAKANKPIREPFGLPSDYYCKRREQERLQSIQNRLTSLEIAHARSAGGEGRDE